MKFEFNPKAGLLVVRAKLLGPGGERELELALDTAASQTLIERSQLVALGSDAAESSEVVPLTTASGMEYVPCVRVSRLIALGQHRTNFSVICHELPPSAAIDGVLGLDFLRGHVLTIDFKTGTIVLE